MRKSLLGWLSLGQQKSLKATPAVRWVESLEDRRLLAAALVVADTVPPTDDKAIAFADTYFGGTSGMEKFTLQNSGDADLNITNFARLGPNPVDFTFAVLDDKGVAVDTTKAFKISAGLTFEMDVAFHPSKVGARSSLYTFNTDDPNNAAVTLSCSGNCLAVPATPPAAPTLGLARTVSSGQINLSWKDNSTTEQGFAVYRATNAAGPFTLKARTAANTSQYDYKGLAAGTHYYFRITAFNPAGESNYTSADATTLPDRGGNTAATATDLGTIPIATALRNYVGTNNAKDYYKFNIPNAGTVRVNLSELTDPVNVRLYRVNADGTLTQLADVAALAGGQGSIAVPGPAGNYMVMVYRGSTTTNSAYRLIIEDDSVGNTRPTANVIGELGAQKAYYGYSGPIDSNDYYKFTLTSTKLVSINLSQLGADLDLELWSNFDTRIANSQTRGVNPETIGHQLTAGTYFIRVFPYSTTLGSTYKLTVSAK